MIKRYNMTHREAGTEGATALPLHHPTAKHATSIQIFCSKETGAWSFIGLWDSVKVSDSSMLNKVPSHTDFLFL